MPIVRSYMCEQCAHQMTITLEADQWDDPPPECPACAERAMRQEFRPVAITGSPSSRAHAIVEDIAAKDYQVANMTDARKEGDVPKVRYKDQNPASLPASVWSGVSSSTLETALAAGRHTRINYGSGLDVLQRNLKDGTEPDLVEISKRRAIRIY